jgi:hypothetical protein
MAIYSAGQKVSQVIGIEFNSSWHIFDGGKFDLIFAPVDSTHAMLLVGDKLADENVVMNNIHHFSESRQAIEASLMALDGPAIPFIKEISSEPAPVPATEIPGIDLEPLFKQSKKKVKTDELDAFWSEAAEGQPAAPLHADGLSYDQARQLGLTPADDRN